MFLVDRPEFVPGHCIVNYSAEDRGGFVDLGDRVLVDPRVYVSRQAVIDMGRLFGFASPEDHAKVQGHADFLATRVDQLEAELADLQRDYDSAAWTLERKFQTKPQPKPGRPKKAAA